MRATTNQQRIALLRFGYEIHKVLSAEEAPFLLQEEFLAFSREICPSDYELELPPHDSSLFLFGRSTGFSMGTYQGTVKTTIRSWKPDEKGFLKKPLTREHRIRAPHGVHS